MVRPPIARTRHAMPRRQLLFLTLLIGTVSSTRIDPTRTLVWGPTIDIPDVDMPVRYLFVQLVDINGDK